MGPTAVRNGARDFDFLFGTWLVRNRRLHEPLSASNDWYEFDSRATERPVLGGLGNLEQIDAERTPTGPLHAVAMRLYDASAGTWSIYWATAGSGAFGVPTVGGFENGIGTFYDREEYDGMPILVRFTWTCSGPASCRWVQAFSQDGGGTWEENWIMEFTKIGDEG
jgi:hypothetical protein